MASMINLEWTGKGLVQPSSLLYIAAIAGLYVLTRVLASVYDVFFGPLSKYPGPKFRAFSRIPKAWTIYTGNEGKNYVALHQKYGPVVRVGPTELSYVGNANTFKDIYGHRKAGEASIIKDPTMIPRSMNGVDSILTADDANHTRQRRLLSHAFADRSLKDLEPMLKSWVAKLIEKLGERAAAGDKTDMLKYYNCTTFDVMADLCFNESLHMLESTEYSPWVTTIFAGLRAFSPFRALKAIGQPFRYLVDDVILRNPAVRKASYQHLKYSSDRVDKRLSYTPDRPDLWTKILEKGKGPDAFNLAEHHITAMLFMGAGTETSATALSGITYHLLQNPASMARLTAEIRGNCSTLDALGLDDLRRLPYLSAVISEGLRMYPPVPIALHRRLPAGGSTILGEHIPGGTTVGVHQLATYRMEYNFKHAFEWHPERFLEDDSSIEFRDDNRGALEPFSTGPRNCIGKNLAYHEIRLILVATLLNFDLRLCEESRAWTDQKVYLLWEKKPLWCTLSPVKAQ